LDYGLLKSAVNTPDCLTDKGISVGDTIAATAFKILIRKIKSQAQWVQLVDSFFQNSPTSNYNEQTFS